VAIADLLTGMSAFQAILLALLQREHTGKGQWIDLSMLDATAQVLTFQATSHLTGGKNPSRMGNRHPSISPYETFRAKDGYFNLAVGNDALFEKLCELLGEPALAEDPRFRENRLRVENRDALVEKLDAHFGRRSVSEWMAELERAGIPAGPINDLERALAHPQLEARGMVAPARHSKLGEIRLLGTPLKLDGVDFPSQVSAPPELGQHTAEVLGEALGLGGDRVSKLAASGAVALQSKP
jgi:crotonobetainyl-CoA:carnitine CoA-transferase CaiB-like acyl-CoA transferase